MLRVDSNSRFKTTEPIIINGRETFGLFDAPSFLDADAIKSINIVKFTVTPQVAGRPDLIANEVYGTPLLDWVVIQFSLNRPRNPLNWPDVGTVISLPSPNIVIGLR